MKTVAGRRQFACRRLASVKLILVDWARYGRADCGRRCAVSSIEPPSSAGTFFHRHALPCRKDRAKPLTQRTEPVRRGSTDTNHVRGWSQICAGPPIAIDRRITSAKGFPGRLRRTSTCGVSTHSADRDFIKRRINAAVNITLEGEVGPKSRQVQQSLVQSVRIRAPAKQG